MRQIDQDLMSLDVVYPGKGHDLVKSDFLQWSNLWMKILAFLSCLSSALLVAGATSHDYSVYHSEVGLDYKDYCKSEKNGLQ